MAISEKHLSNHRLEEPTTGRTIDRTPRPHHPNKRDLFAILVAGTVAASVGALVIAVTDDDPPAPDRSSPVDAQVQQPSSQQLVQESIDQALAERGSLTGVQQPSVQDYVERAVERGSLGAVQQPSVQDYVDRAVERGSLGAVPPQPSAQAIVQDYIDRALERGSIVAVTPTATPSSQQLVQESIDQALAERALVAGVPQPSSQQLVQEYIDRALAERGATRAPSMQQAIADAQAEFRPTATPSSQQLVQESIDQALAERALVAGVPQPSSQQLVQEYIDRALAERGSTQTPSMQQAIADAQAEYRPTGNTAGESTAVPPTERGLTVEAQPGQSTATPPTDQNVVEVAPQYPANVR